MQHPCIEWRHRRTASANHLPHFLDQRLGPGHRSPQHPALAIDVLRGRMQDQINGVIERLLQGGRAEAVVDHSDYTGLAGNLTNGLKVGNLCEWVRWRLQIKEPRVGADGGLPLPGIG